MQKLNQPFKTPAFKLAESGMDDVQLFRVGTFHHAEYGQFEITPTLLKVMEQNFKNKVRGIDIAIDYKHDSDDVAAGWVHSVYLSQDEQELWAKVDWTENGKKIIQAKEFRYLSPEFVFDYQDNETLKKFGPVLLGAGLTNRPTIKQMEPVIELSEYIQKTKPKGVGTVDYKAMELDPAKLDQMSPEDLKALVLQLLSKMKEMEGINEAAEKKMGAMESEKKMSEKKQSFLQLLSEGKACKAQEQAYLDGDMAKFIELASPIKLHEQGNANHPAPTASISSREDAEAEVIKLAQKKVSEKSAKDIDQGIHLVLMEKPELVSKIYQ